jgi:hypothetical protein
MFLNLARRSQSLVDRMIGELDQIERGEEDPKRLAQLFELDHLATRMRRNDENLLVLAGADSSAPRREDALLVDALRAAQSEVELYNRIEFGTIDTDIAITSLAVNDVVRLIAELLDNATRFSPPTTVVVADARRVRDYVVVQIEDRGLGMSEEQMRLLNQRLAEPPTVDVGAFRLMGLAVTGRLASRYGIRIELRANIEGGTIAQIILPSSIVVLPGRPIEPSRGRRVPQLDGPGGGWATALPAGRAGGATATLQAIAPEPWSQPQQQVSSHPSLPMMPSQRPIQRPVATPTPDRPPLPRRAEPATPPPPATPAPVAADAALVQPTVAYPTVQPMAAPDLQVAVGFVTPDGQKIPPTPRPAPPNSSGWGAALAAMPPPPPPPAPAPAQERAEAPIFLQMQASWFKGQQSSDPDDWGMPTAGYAPSPRPGSVTPPPPAPAPAPVAPPPPVIAPSVQPSTEQHDRAPNGAAGSGSGHNGGRPANAGSETDRSMNEAKAAPSVPRPRTPAEDHWRTAADEGWQRAMAAAEPPDAGTTRSGLPKRVPQAQLVPGGVQSGPGKQDRRSPDEVRGLLSAYHRGVQRGRTAGSAEAAAGAPAPKENGQ